MAQVTRTGCVDHATAVSEMAAADVLLFHAPALNRGPPGKNDALGVSPRVRTETLRRFSRPALARDLAAVLAESIDAPAP